MTRNSLIRRIHVLKRELALDDETYRTILESISGKRSCSEIDDEYVNLVLKSLEGQASKVRQTRVQANVRLQRKIARLGYILKWSWRDIAGFCFKETGKRSTQSCSAAELNKVVNGMIAVTDDRLDEGLIVLSPTQLDDYLRHTHRRRVNNATQQNMKGAMQ